jgi:hypothetical protein
MSKLRLGEHRPRGNGARGGDTPDPAYADIMKMLAPTA